MESISKTTLCISSFHSPLLSHRLMLCHFARPIYKQVNLFLQYTIIIVFVIYVYAHVEIMPIFYVWDSTNINIPQFHCIQCLRMIVCRNTTKIYQEYLWYFLNCCNHLQPSQEYLQTAMVYTKLGKFTAMIYWNHGKFTAMIYCNHGKFTAMIYCNHGNFTAMIYCNHGKFTAMIYCNCGKFTAMIYCNCGKFTAMVYTNHGKFTATIYTNHGKFTAMV